ncbi:cryptochrome/photolyase family protein [Algicella marina]|uniref:Deoxyribodipyrimidine photo-lyase n=1 Tax=Algicella marina TaxID=2683284 RepID=A0A6P1T0C5_9RHOB|nr:deoxyribodipyrimidine photo-lyase [Algicella marina]QHQ35457.1 deoxyribodipyrimidine photo-lyase [Algicella marina]
MTAPLIFWFRRDFRLSDHPGLVAAAETGRPLIPVCILDPETEALGAAPRWRLERAIACFAKTLEERGSRLILRRGLALDVLEALVRETGAEAVHWSRLYDPAARDRDSAVKSALKGAGIEACSHAGHLLYEPWTVETGEGEFYKVFSPFWRAVSKREPAEPLSPPDFDAPADWPDSDVLEDWQLGQAMQRGAEIVGRHARIGAAAAAGRLGSFIAHGIDTYKADRDRLDRDGTSGLSQNLSLGEISARVCWHAADRARQEGKTGAETFMKELVWREFAYHLLFHTPHIIDANWREEWGGFPWQQDNDAAERWRRGMTGEPMIDGAMRELYVTGTMHNRARMLVASYLTKHLMTDWRVGQRWFEECLIDWDPASNALGWQWTAGSGPDAAPYFRVFNPALQGEKFDPEGTYRAAWLAEGNDAPTETALSFFEAIPKSWNMSPDDDYPQPIVGLKEGREKALAAYGKYKG